MSVRAALVCHRNPPSSTEWTYWDSIGQAHLAESELTPCDAECIGVHTVVSVDPTAPARRGGRPRREDVNS